MKFSYCLIFFFISTGLLAQESVSLRTNIPDPLALRKVSFHRSFRKPLAEQHTPLELGDSIVLTRYNIQQYLITDTAKAFPVWFSILLGFDGTDYWLVADTDYNGNFKDEQPHKLSIPAGITHSKTGERFGSHLMQIELSSFPLNDTLIHPSFPLFLQAEFGYLSESRSIDSLVLSSVLWASHKPNGRLLVNGSPVLMVLQLYPLMTDFSLFSYYNPNYQKQCIINVVDTTASAEGPLLGYGNAWSFMFEEKPIEIISSGVHIKFDDVEYSKQKLFLRTENENRTLQELALLDCDGIEVSDIISGSSFSLMGKDSLVLYFTGSWCPPCRKLTPLVEAYFKQLPPGWRGYVIACERSEAEAQRYLSNFSFKHAIYANLDDKSDCSLRKIYGIGIYPTLLYLSPAGKVVWQGTTLRHLAEEDK